MLKEVRKLPPGAVGDTFKASRSFSKPAYADGDVQMAHNPAAHHNETQYKDNGIEAV